MEKYTKANVVFSKFARDYMAMKRDLPVRPSEMAVINIITRREGNFTPLAIAELLGVSKPMIAAHIASLEKKGYIFKKSSDLDKRSFYVCPTRKGIALADEARGKQTDLLKKIESAVGEDAFARLVEAMELATDAIKNER